MIVALLLLASQPTALSPADTQAHFDECVSEIAEDPAKAVDLANAWRLAGGGVPARHCLALAYAAQQRFAPAAVAFEQAAREADAANDQRAANLWVQAGNARLAAQEPEAAKLAFDSALARGVLKDARLGEAHLDRARAKVALNDTAGARADLDAALKLAPADPLAWLLSATLARRMDDLPRAQKDIAEATTRSPDDASVALEAGNIAILSGAPDAAKIAWEQAVKNQPDSPAAASARTALARLAEDSAK